MYYKLKDEFRLRGWELLPTGIVQRLSGAVEFLPPAVYHTLQKACGSLPVGSALFSAEEKQILSELCAAEILVTCEKPAPLSAEQRYHAYPNRFLYSIHWAITSNCNCRCRIAVFTHSESRCSASNAYAVKSKLPQPIEFSRSKRSKSSTSDHT